MSINTMINTHFELVRMRDGRRVAENISYDYAPIIQLLSPEVMRYQGQLKK